MSDLHNILFNMQAMYSFALGIYAAYLASQNKPISGNFWGSVAIYAGLNVVVLIVGIILAVTGHTIASDGRVAIYILYMLYLIVIMPGLFSMLSGRDDRRASLAFGMLAVFNASVSFSMVERGLSIWILPS